MNAFTTIGAGLAALALGFGAGYLIRQLIAKKIEGTAEARSNRILAEAKEKAQQLLIGARDKSVRLLEEAKKEDQEQKKRVISLEQSLLKKDELLGVKEQDLQKRQGVLDAETSRIHETEKELLELKNKEVQELEKISALSKEEAKDLLIADVEKNCKNELYSRLEKLQQYGKEELERKARDMIAVSIQRYAASQTGETTTTTVALPSDDIKGRIIGKEGRNIKALERLTGVELIIDDTPEAIVISGFDPVRRNVAKLALEKLISDGRIQPARIEEAVLKAKEDISDKINEAGEAAMYDAGIIGIDQKLVWLLGRLRYRTSYGQNVLMHSLEVCHLSGALAAELGADVIIAKKAGLFHDIGKAIDHEVEGSHVEIGRNLLKKFGVQEEVVKAMQSHHEDYPYETLEARIVQAADAISAARPGARKDSLEDYIRRLAELEGIATSFKGVEKAYAIQAGREVRVFVTPEEIDDLSAGKLARDVANRIQEELRYPGEIKVVVIREKRIIEYAR